jgi:uncharacterized protein
MTPPTPYPLSAARTLALHAQGLTTPNGSESTPTPDTINDTVERLGCVQIDTLHIVQRSHYLAPWSRLGAYDPKDYDRLVYDPARRAHHLPQPLRQPAKSYRRVLSGLSYCY